MKNSHINTLLYVSNFYKSNGKLPSQTSKDPMEKILASWISNQRQIKKGKDKGVWYPILETLLTELGLPLDLFESIDNEQNAINTLKEVSEFYKSNCRMPSISSKDPKEKRLYRWIITQKRAKQGNCNNKWYPILETFLKELGLPEDLFEFIDKEYESINALNEVSEFYKNNGKLPSSKSKDPKEKRLGIWIVHSKQCKNGKGNRKWYPILEKNLTELGLPLDLFDHIDREQEAINVLKEVSEFYKNNCRVPSISSKDPKEKRLGLWIRTQKQSKHGKNKCIWYPLLETKLRELGLPENLFHS